MECGKLPKHVIIEPTNECNLKCKYCPNRFIPSDKGFMDVDTFKKIINQLDKNIDIDIFRRGESLLHPDIVEMIEYANPKVKSITLTTNATLLIEELSKKLIKYLSFIHFSIDVPNLYKKFRGTDYDAVLNKINLFLKLNRRKVKTQVSLVKTKNHTDDDIEQFKKQWCKKVDFVRIYEPHSSNGIIGSLKNKRPHRKPCTKLFYEMLIFWDGKVGRCNHDWSNTYIGNINTHTIKDIWNNFQHYHLRLQHATNKITDPVCKNCDSWYEYADKCTIGKTLKGGGSK